jgi:hypothetical protein
VIAPTGKPADLSAQPLATDATGMGVPQALAGVALERIVGPWLFDVIGTVTVRAPRAVQGIDALLAPRWTATLASAYVFRSGAALSLALSYAVETDAWLGGVQVPRSGRRDPQIAVAAIVPFADRWRLLFGVVAHPPIPGVGQNTLATLGASTTLTRVWW